MNEREKMIELLLSVPKPQEYAVARRNGKGLITAGMIADHLIANGVTVQQWIQVSERLPEENDVYMVSAFDGHARRTTFAQWQNRLKRWYLTGARSYWKVTHWMPMPEPPKEQ